MSGWVDFKELRAHLNAEDVLKHYNVEVNRRGDQHTGFCPLPGHGGNRKSPSFSVELKRGIFQCFGCQAKGNILDFAALMENVEAGDGRGLRQVAARLQTEFCPELAKYGGKRRANAALAESAQGDLPQLEVPNTTATKNPPLDFELKGLDPSHPYLAERGFAKETIAHFGLGYCGRGSLAGRIAIPLHDIEGQLVGYAGRVVDDASITEENPRYCFPGRRERNGQQINFRKTLLLYNGHRQKRNLKDLVVVEGFPSVWWLTQHGFPRVVATMGAECAEEQIELIVSLTTPDARVRVMPNDDKAGEKFACMLLTKLAPRRFVRWAKLKDGDQPTDLSAQELNACLSV